MSQLNINMTSAFEANLERFMQIRGISAKSDAVRIAVQEGLERSLMTLGQRDFGSWLGKASEGMNPTPRFKSDDDLWK